MRSQITVAVSIGIISVAIIMLFGGAVYYFQNKYSYLDFYKRLETRVSIAGKYYLDQDLNTEALKHLRDQHFEKLEGEKEIVIEMDQGVSAQSVSAKYNLPGRFVEKVLSEGMANEKSGTTFFAGIKRMKNNQTYLIIVSAENYYVSHHLIFLRKILITAAILMILTVVSLSVYFSTHFFAPIKGITDRVKQISTENIHLRLNNNARNNEINELINTFNDLLNRIETAFETQKNFISNASHELGTPLTSIIGEADVALIKERKPEDYKKTLQNILIQAERLDQITKSLLFLAQTGYKGDKIVFETLRTDEIIWEVKQVIDKLNPQNKIFIDLGLLPEDPKKLKIKGNKQLLHLAIANILNNACKYSYNKPVSVSIAASNNQVIIVVKDDGVGIPKEELPYIYDPFFRASNTHFFEGYGIGLPLARNIILLHKGKLSVFSEANKGTIVHIHFPLFFV